MKEIIYAIITGVVQGLTEFLPVSSSGHIELAKEILGLKIEEDENLLFTIVLHTATALSTIFIFRKDILNIIKGVFSNEKGLKYNENEDFRFVIKIIISMIPAALFGYFFESKFDEYFAGNILFIGFMLIVTAILLYFADMAKKTDKNISNLHALIIGVSQAIAIIPGISRSGATISSSVLLGIDRTKSARFSFLMVVPLIFGAMAKKTLEGNIVFDTSNFGFMLAGFLAAFISGCFACKWMIDLVKKAQLKYFSIYCVIVGIIAIIYALFYK